MTYLLKGYFLMEVKDQIREIRGKTGYSRKKFSDAYGIPVRTLEEWEAGRRTPPDYVVRLLSYVVEIEVMKAEGEDYGEK